MESKDGRRAHIQRPIECLDAHAIKSDHRTPNGKRIEIKVIFSSRNFARTVILTSARPWKFSQPEGGVVTGDRLKADVRVPILFGILLLLAEFSRVENLTPNRANDVDFIVVAMLLSAEVGDWMDMQPGGARLARELSKTVG
jgi:hypothetical protein